MADYLASFYKYMNMKFTRRTSLFQQQGTTLSTIRVPLEAQSAPQSERMHRNSHPADEGNVPWTGRIPTLSLQQMTYYAVVAALCAWVLWLPLYPSQDGPLHLYYANALSHLLRHDATSYASLYRIKAVVTPYSLYYYALIFLGRMFNFETADKLLVCTYLVLLAATSRFFLKTVDPLSVWSSYLVLPVLLNWPLLMGFLNYSFSMCIALFGLGCWMRFRRHRSRRYALMFLLSIAWMTITHPVPWIFLMGYCFLDLLVEFVRRNGSGKRWRQIVRTLGSDLALLMCSLLAFPYFFRFHGMIQTVDPEQQTPSAFSLGAHIPAFARSAVVRSISLSRTLGIDVFGGPSLECRVYRFGIALLFFGCVVVCVAVLFDARKDRYWSASRNWALFTVFMLPTFLFAPDKLADHFYFMSRLGVLIYLGAIAGASTWLRTRPNLASITAAFSYVLAIFTVALAMRYITPVAQSIALLRETPVTHGEGLILQTTRETNTPGLNYLPYSWAAANYFRRHNLLMYNTAWLGDPIILIGIAPGSTIPHDRTYYEAVPYPGSPMLPDSGRTSSILSSVHFLMILRSDPSKTGNPLSDTDLGLHTTGTPDAWRCEPSAHDMWSFCRNTQSAIR